MTTSRLVGSGLPPALEGCLVRGVAAIERFATEAAPDAPTPCAAWTVLDVVRHLECIAGAYVLWASAASGGRRRRALVGDEMAAYNDLMLQRLPVLPVAVHLARFAALARDHARLAAVAGDAPMTEFGDDGLLTVGQHAHVAAIEYHVHAWDLARAAATTHLPDAQDVALLVGAWVEHVTPMEGSELEAPTWTGLLRASGRTP